MLLLLQIQYQIIRFLHRQTKGLLRLCLRRRLYGVDLSRLVSPASCNTSCFVSYRDSGEGIYSLSLYDRAYNRVYYRSSAKWTAGDNRYDGHRDSGIVSVRYNTTANLYRQRSLVHDWTGLTYGVFEEISVSILRSVDSAKLTTCHTQGNPGADGFTIFVNVKSRLRSH